MNDGRNAPSGASSDDTTSALFVSARKKQLQQQEAERLAREKEAQRLAAEAEVQRLEREVEERRRQAEEQARWIEYENAEKRRLAEEEARHVEYESAERRRLAEEEARRMDYEVRAKQTQAARSPQEPRNAQNGESLPKASPFPAKKAKPVILAAIGAAAAVVAVVLIVIFTGGGNGGNANDDWDQGSIDDGNGYALNGESPYNNGRAAEYDIYGSYYMLDENYRVLYEHEFFFDSDMTARVGGGHEWHSFEISGEILTIHVDGFATEFLIIDSDTLYSFEDGTNFVRNPAVYDVYEDAPEDNEPWAINPDAELDSAAYLQMLNMGVLYPGDIFYVSENTDEFLGLWTHDPNGGIFNVQALASFDAGGGLSADVVGPQVTGYGESVIRTTFSQLGSYSIVEEYPYSSAAGATIQYTAVISCDVGGTPMTGIVRIALWHSFINGQPTNVYHYYSIVMIVHDDVFGDYRQVFGNMRDSTFHS